MKKRLQKIIIGALVVVVLIGALIFLNLSTPGETPQDQGIRFFAPEKSWQDVKSIFIENYYSSYTIVFGDDGYTIDAAENLPLDLERLSSSRYFFGRLNAQFVVDDGEGSAVYGLDAPRATVTLTYTSGQTLKLILGSTVNTGTYVQVVGESSIYFFSTAQAEPFFWEPRAYVSRVVTGRMTGIIFERAVFEGNVRPEPVMLEPNPERELSGVDYLVVLPRHRVAGRAAGILTSLSDIRALEVAYLFPDERTIEFFGLSSQEAYSVVTIEWEGNMVVFTASEPTATGHFYMMTSWLPVIYFMDSSPYNNEFPLLWYESLYQDFLSTFILNPVFDSLSEIEIATQAEVHTFVLSGRGNYVSDATNGRQIDFETFYPLFRLLATAPNEGFFEEELPSGVAHIMTITYRYADTGRADSILAFYEFAPRRAVGVLDLYPEAIIRTGYLEEIIAFLIDL